MNSNNTAAMRHYKALRERSREYVAPIARLIVGEDDSLSVSLYAPGLPPGEHDLFPVAVHQRTCIWTSLPNEIDAYEGCASIHHVGRDDEGPTLPAYCSDCGGAVVVGSDNGAPEQPSEPKA